MNSEILRLVDQYEAGRINRRQLVAGIGSLVAIIGGSSATQLNQDDKATDSPTFEATDLNHIALSVTDVARSRDFYVQHLGLNVTRESERQCFLSCGKQNFVALFQNEKAGMHHYCYSLDEYDVNEAEAKLNEHRLEPRVVRSDGRIYFSDPDGLTVQLAQRERIR